MIRQTFHQACYNGPEETWRAAIAYFAERGDKRMVRTITEVMERQLKGPKSFRYDIGIRFRDGSIDKMNAFILSQEDDL